MSIATSSHTPSPACSTVLPPRRREIWLDLTRIVACFLVCLIHAPITNVGSDPIWLRLYTFASQPCNALFFMISGALLFPIKTPLRSYVSKKVKRLALPIVFWSLFALGLRTALGQMTVQEAFSKTLLIPFVRIEGVYWFMYCLLGLYLFAPLISPAVVQLSNLRYILPLWGITLCLPIINLVLPGACDLGSYTSLFSTFGGFLGYMLLGYYLRFHQPAWRVCLPWLCMATLAAILYSGACHYFSIKGAAFGNLDLNTAIFAVVLFLCCKYIGTRIGSLSALGHTAGRLLADVSQQTFGIYLIHIFIMREVLWHVWEHLFPKVSYAIQIPAIAGATFILSYLIIKLLRLIPAARHVL